MTAYSLPSNHPPLRLDKALAQEMGLGLRRCRDLIDQGLVMVDGRPWRKGDLVGPGQRIVVDVLPGPVAPACPEVVIVTRDGRFAALHKPGGLHTVAGKGPCLEALLPALGLEGWRLVNRLDGLTSGLVLAVRRAEDEALYTAWQDQGLVAKWYLALVHGRCHAMVLRGRILDTKRTVVRVTADDDVHVRWTHAFPVRTVGPDTLVLVRIFKGRRHQIRAHLSHAGHPILGDPVHGLAEEGGLFLHHWRLDMPEFSASTPPPWADVDLEPVEAVWKGAVSVLREESVST